jgi:uncharacterized protein (TIGR04255 family)
VVDIPKKLKTDSIIEALLDIHFEPDPSFVPEIFYGRLADVGEWRGFRQARLPTADIPVPLRRFDPGLRYQPSIELVSPDGSISIRFGPQVLIYSRRGTYPGWDNNFGLQLDNLTDELYRIVPSVHVSRLGLRYINALKSDVHGINNIDDLQISINVAGSRLLNNLNLNFKRNVGTNVEVMCRIASVDLAEGNVPTGTTVIVDIDVYTGKTFSARSDMEVKRWIKEAHGIEKENFFSVLGPDATQRLRED